ncbi:hypothetical protein A4X09_0g5833 [Tilletia walkeri]|uniref:Ribokinase n=1 Tax=Tilletia walkeri TaxID=117179 RepID=A0A8X7T2Q6_9BASI|nr:hypothetical protein A4X09_0g5833 [Tilletia walkeri]
MPGIEDERGQQPHRHPRLALVRSSINVDETFTVSAIARPGQTISSKGYQARAGGKGANVAAAIGLALLPQDQEGGAGVRLVGAVGQDATWPLDNLKKSNVDISGVSILEDVPTGRAFIQVAEDGENSIVLLKGANYTRTLDDAEGILAGGLVGCLVLQNEIPLETTRGFVKAAAGGGTGVGRERITTIFNPSPMLTRDEAAEFEWDHVDVLVVNEGEAEALLALLDSPPPSSSSSTSPIGERLTQCRKVESIRWIVVTRGNRGLSAYVRTPTSSERRTIDQVAFKPDKVVDTTGAGDTFLGYLVAGLLMSEAATQGGVDDANLPTSPQVIEQILRSAACAAAMAVEKTGAMESIPNGLDVKKRLAELTNSE